MDHRDGLPAFLSHFKPKAEQMPKSRDAAVAETAGSHAMDENTTERVVFPADFPPSSSSVDEWTAAFERCVPGCWAEALAAYVSEAPDHDTLRSVNAVCTALLSWPEPVLEILLCAAATPVDFDFIRQALGNGAAQGLADHKGLVDRLSAFFARLPPELTPSDARGVTQIAQAVHVVATATTAFRQFFRDHPAEQIEEAAAVEDGADELANLPGLKFKKSQKERKQAKKAQRSTVKPPSLSKDEEAAFQVLNVKVPVDLDSSLAASNKVIQAKARVTIQFLDCLNDPSIAEYLVDRHFSATASERRKATVVTLGVVGPSKAAQSNGKSEASTAAIVPSAYPAVVPLKAAALLGSATPEDFGQWRLHMANKATQSLRSFKDQNTFEIAVKKMRELSNGFFSDDNQKVLSGYSDCVPIYEAKLTRDLRLIYEVDLMPDSETGSDQQILKIWNICTHREIDERLYHLISSQSQQRSREYRDRCIYRTTPRNCNKAQNVTMPMTWPMENYEEGENSQTKAQKKLTEEDYLRLHAALALEKFTPVTQSFVRSIFAGDESAVHAFALSGREQQVILHTGSVICHGRSGTGKTTAILFKMIAQSNSWPDQPQSRERGLRQIFTTQSAVLASRVREYYDSLVETNAFDRMKDEEAKARAKQKQDAKQNAILVDLDDEELSSGGLPARFSQLEDRHFPLFLSFDALCCLLEADYGTAFTPRRQTKEQRRALHRYKAQHSEMATTLAELGMHVDDETDSATAQGASSEVLERTEAREERLAHLVSTRAFAEEYWPHIDQSLTKGFDPDMVFGEILGVICGSEAALETATGYLDREAYSSYSARQQGTFVRQRDRVYAIFEAYLKLKVDFDGHDTAERTHALVRAMNDKPVPSTVDYFFVDECQDNLIIDSILMKKLCSNSQGFLYAGDVAQQINSSTGFRFEDLGAAFYRGELSDPLVVAGKREAAKPEVMNLSMNYRSHGGIVDVADSLVNLIKRFFPASVDNLDKERGVVNGPRPTVFDGWDSETMELEQFALGERDGVNHVEFGANQVLLVRNDEARDALRKRLGDIGLVLTVSESKGLEFSDVLVWDFFSDGTGSTQEWRLVLEGIAKASPKFDDVKHGKLRTELKTLYVAVTRARNHLWIFDRDSEKLAPIKAYWSHHGLVSIVGPNDVAPELAVSSSPQDWETLARRMFEKKMWKHASLCYIRANKPDRAAVCSAYNQREIARRKTAGDAPSAAKAEAWAEAGARFLDCGRLFSALGGATVYYKYAGAYFERAGQSDQAGLAYEEAEEYTEALRCFRQAGEFNEVVRLLRERTRQIDDKVQQPIRDATRHQFLRTRQFKKARELFYSDQDMCDFAADYINDTTRGSMLEWLGMIKEAGELALENGEVVDAVKLLIKGKEEAHAHEVAISHLWLWFPIGATRTKSPEVEELLKVAKEAETAKDRNGKKLRQQNVSAKLGMFNALAGDDLTALVQKGLKFRSDGKWNAATLCLDRGLRKSTQFNGPQKVDETIQPYQIYVDGIRRLIDNEENQDELLRVLGVRPAAQDANAILRTANEMVVSVRSPLREFLSDRSKSVSKYGLVTVIRSAGPSGVDAVVELNQIADSARRFLAERLQTRLVELHNANKAIATLRPVCLATASGSPCKVNSCGDEHPASWTRESLVEKTHALIGISTLLRVLRHLSRFHKNPIRIKEAQDVNTHWMQTLWRVLLPATARVGTLVAALPYDGEDWRRLCLLDTTHDTLFELHSDKSPATFVSSLNQQTYLASVFHPRSWLSYYARLPSNWKSAKHPAFIRDNRSIAQDLNAFTSAHLEGRTSYETMWQASQYFRRIMDMHLNLDLHTALPHLERLATATILSMCPAVKEDAGLHGLMLPRSYLVDMALVPTFGGGGDWALTQVILEVFLQLVERAYSGDDPALAYDGVPAPRCSGSVQGAYFGRLLRLLVGFCLNLRAYDNEAFGLIRRLASQDRPLPLAYRRYLEAKHFGGLVAAYRGSDEKSGLDPILKLSHTSHKNEMGVGGSVVMHFRDWPDFVTKGLKLPLPAIGQSSTAASSDGAAGKKSPAANGIVPSSVETASVAKAASGSDTHADGPSLIAKSAITTPLRAVAVQDRAVKVTETQKRAAGVILATWRRRRQRTLPGKGRSMSEALERTVRKRAAEYRAVVVRLDSAADQKIRLQCAVLGPLVHFTVAAEVLVRRLAQLKKDFKTRSNQARHDDLEWLQQQITRINELWKPLNELHKRLLPGCLSISSFADVQDLVRPFMGLYASAQSVLSKDAEMSALAKHIEIGERGLLRKPAPMKALPLRSTEKPKLNMSDDYGDIDDVDVSEDEDEEYDIGDESEFESEGAADSEAAEEEEYRGELGRSAIEIPHTHIC